MLHALVMCIDDSSCTKDCTEAFPLIPKSPYTVLPSDSYCLQLFPLVAQPGPAGLQGTYVTKERMRILGFPGEERKKQMHFWCFIHFWVFCRPGTV